MSDFRAETIYFIVVDRFCDGNVGNNLGKDEDYDPTHTNWWKWWGGDLRGVLSKLDYLQSLGVTSLWLTPLFDQMDGTADIGGERMAPYHGYWAKDFKRIDEHLVDEPDDVRLFHKANTVFDELVAEMHRRGMKLVLDIVCNHSSPAQVGGRGGLYDDGKLVASYDQGRWYRRAKPVLDWNDLEEVQTGDLAGLADFDEESWEYRQYIKSAMKLWLDKGVDAFRVDTVKHMPLWFWQEFTGDMTVHRPDLFMFGEWFQGGCWDAESVTFARRSGMSMLDFAWRNAVTNALAHRSQRGFEELADVVEHDVAFRDPSVLVTFVDNHDLPRFLSLSNDPARFRAALLLTMVGRGIPCVYYGNENDLHDDTNRGNDPYNRPMMASFEPTPVGREIALLAALRRRNPALQKGGMRKKYLDPDRYAFTRCWFGSTVLVAINRSDDVADLGITGVEMEDGTFEDVLGGASIEVVEASTRIVVPPRGIVVYEQVGTPVRGRVLIDVQVHHIQTAFGQRIYISGDAPELGQWDIERAVPLEYVNRETWAGTLAFDASVGHEVHYKYVVKSPKAWEREPGRGHHRNVPAREVNMVGAPEGCITEIWRDDWRN